MGGRMEGRKNGGANGGDNFSHTWRGDEGALKPPVSHFVAEKIRFLNFGI